MLATALRAAAPAGLQRAPVAVAAAVTTPAVLSAQAVRRLLGPTRRLGTAASRAAASSAAAAHYADMQQHAPRPLPAYVKIVEVGPRDGLQNEKAVLPASVKLELIARLAAAGLPAIEATSFVSAKWVPQMGDAAEVAAGLLPLRAALRADAEARAAAAAAAEATSSPSPPTAAARRRAPAPPLPALPTFSALTPNVKGLEGALGSAGAFDEVAVFAAATDGFSRRNINCGVIDSFERFRPIVEGARAAGLRVRGYVSCVLGCPYDGPVHPEAVAYVAATLLEMGCYEVSLGDTIGVGTPTGVHALLSCLRAHGIPMSSIAVHFHATYGAAPANILAALEEGVSVVDAAVAGLGGCPYAAGASGNVATEDVVYMLHGMGVATGVNLDALADTGEWIASALGRKNESRAGAAHIAGRRAAEKRAAEAAAKGDAAGAAALFDGASCWPVPWPVGSVAPLPLLEAQRAAVEEHVADESATSAVTARTV